ncbi:CAP domain-containing protein [uncultured Polaribacter sp.]|uniref:CAP domain-containing protein n=1 Tax=uncultured Polaribacter sp. TaxID=174711 RepID=UPI00261073CE|nr:CAP domain-containing protein [uncultured Polaribacter sp.]
MRKILKYSAILAVLLLGISCSETSESTSMIDETISSESAVENEIIELLNKYRSSKSLSELNKLDVIKTQTDIHTDYMIEKMEISHDDFTNRADYLKKNTSAKLVAENVAVGYSTPKAVVDGWIKSDGHRKNIEGNFTHFHVTAKQNSNNVWYYTNIFISK